MLAACITSGTALQSNNSWHQSICLELCYKWERSCSFDLNILADLQTGGKNYAMNEVVGDITNNLFFCRVKRAEGEVLLIEMSKQSISTLPG